MAFSIRSGRLNHCETGEGKKTRGMERLRADPFGLFLTVSNLLSAVKRFPYAMNENDVEFVQTLKVVCFFFSTFYM